MAPKWASRNAQITRTMGWVPCKMDTRPKNFFSYPCPIFAKKMTMALRSNNDANPFDTRCSIWCTKNIKEQRMLVVQEPAAAGSSNSVKPKNDWRQTCTETRRLRITACQSRYNGSWYFQGHNITQLFERYRNVAPMPNKPSFNTTTGGLLQRDCSTCPHARFGPGAAKHDGTLHCALAPWIYDIGLSDPVYLEVSTTDHCAEHEQDHSRRRNYQGREY
ncbi:uncharacterized protein BYT42DRAFT_646872 [Radiomyces spectabilis]|uniref:uncharacterized protein n=1 Tax=Radiomyces spectabilis TaxID=64574 RepID=UPI00221E8295|nr:uncharacterized protein BYT42DRAFT_646872 [Radiomyces spectabilis]KAI8372902.1 hypothetical protein BYT42DRAFT_646872 [Radiomyces spectabilis]